MKEGYLQGKIAELNEKCQMIDRMIALEKANIERLQQQVGGFKELLKRLKNVETFKQQTMSEIIEENKKQITTLLEKMTKDMQRLIEKTMKHKTKNIEETLQYLKNQEENIRLQQQTLSQQQKNIDFLLRYNKILTLRLMNKGVLSNRDITDIERRAAKESKQ